jgi:hypothetical protein
LAYQSTDVYDPDGTDAYGAGLLVCKDKYGGTKTVAKLVGGSNFNDVGSDNDCMFSLDSNEVLGYCIITEGKIVLSDDDGGTLSFKDNLGVDDGLDYMSKFVADIWKARLCSRQLSLFIATMVVRTVTVDA